MGIYDRSYYEADERVSTSGSVIPKLIATTVIVYIVDNVLTQSTGVPGSRPLHVVAEFGALSVDWWQQPWKFYQLITYGFLHAQLDDPSGRGVLHILFNMFMLYVMGKGLEQRIGSREFLVVYFVGMVVGGLVWSIVASLVGDQGSCVGASGAVSAVFIAFAVKAPRERMLLMGVIEMPLFAIALLMLGMNVMGALGAGGSNVAYTAHLGGALFGGLYAYRDPNWSSLIQPGQLKRAFRRKPRLKLVKNEYGDMVDKDDAEEDRILAKIREQGTGSLTSSERKFMQKRSEALRKRRES